MRSFKPCIYAGKNPPSSLFNYSNKIKSHLLFNQNDFNIKVKNLGHGAKQIRKLNFQSLPLTGDFQYDHAGAALSAIDILDPKS